MNTGTCFYDILKFGTEPKPTNDDFVSKPCSVGLRLACSRTGARNISIVMDTCNISINYNTHIILHNTCDRRELFATTWPHADKCAVFSCGSSSMTVHVARCRGRIADATTRDEKCNLSALRVPGRRSCRLLVAGPAVILIVRL